MTIADKYKSREHVSVICIECDAPFMMHIKDTEQVCPKCKNKSDVAECNGTDAEVIDFEKWLNELGGNVRVSNVMGVDRTTAKSLRYGYASCRCLKNLLNISRNTGNCLETLNVLGTLITTTKHNVKTANQPKR